MWWIYVGQRRTVKESRRFSFVTRVPRLQQILSFGPKTKLTGEKDFYLSRGRRPVLLP